MPAIAKFKRPSLSTGSPSNEHQLAGLYAGEPIAAGDACTINADGDIMLRRAGEAFRGVAFIPTPTADGVTLWSGVNFHYGSGLTPGTEVFLDDAVPGGLNTTGAVGAISVGYVVDSGRIHFYALSGRAAS